jgi:universal stress protein A
MFQTILAALKFSASGRCAFETACRLARLHRARLHVLHVVDIPRTESSLIILEDRAPGVVDSVRRRFEVELQPLLEGYPFFSFHCLEGRPACEVCALARNLAADLIVLGCHQRSGCSSITRLGETGTLILESAPCLVLLAPCRDGNRGATR